MKSLDGASHVFSHRMVPLGFSNIFPKINTFALLLQQTHFSSKVTKESAKKIMIWPMPTFSYFPLYAKTFSKVLMKDEKKNMKNEDGKQTASVDPKEREQPTR